MPATLTPGRKASIQLTDTVSDVQPDQPISDSINVVGPGLAEQLIDRYPQGPTSMTYDYTLAEGTEDDFTITVGFESSYVIYHYTRG